MKFKSRDVSPIVPVTSSQLHIPPPPTSCQQTSRPPIRERHQRSLREPSGGCELFPAPVCKGQGVGRERVLLPAPREIRSQRERAAQSQARVVWSRAVTGRRGRGWPRERGNDRAKFTADPTRSQPRSIDRSLHGGMQFLAMTCSTVEAEDSRYLIHFTLIQYVDSPCTLSPASFQKQIRAGRHYAQNGDRDPDASQLEAGRRVRRC
ncbi:hypothetical protein JHW43_004442 [Diplocarpon mali]|nr:hypothetical protein JHW43_004442 [Diplocarpon mali]